MDVVREVREAIAFGIENGPDDNITILATPEPVQQPSARLSVPVESTPRATPSRSKGRSPAPATTAVIRAGTPSSVVDTFVPSTPSRHGNTDSGSGINFQLNATQSSTINVNVNLSPFPALPARGKGRLQFDFGHYSRKFAAYIGWKEEEAAETFQEAFDAAKDEAQLLTALEKMFKDEVKAPGSLRTPELLLSLFKLDASNPKKF